MTQRRKFFKDSLKAGLGLAMFSGLSAKAQAEAPSTKKSPYTISLAEWSLRDWLNSGKISNLDFPETTKKVFDIHAVEYVSSFFKGQETDSNYLRELKSRSDGAGVRNVMIMVDMWGQDGALASPEESVRKTAAQNHHKWVDAAKYLGCHAIRVNASGYGDANYRDAMGYFADGLAKLVEYGAANQISIIVENHGGYSSNGRWLADVIRKVDNSYCGTLPDFGNFRTDLETGNFYDPYIGVAELMPYAKGVSAKSMGFDHHGQDTTIDFKRMMNIVAAFNFEGFVGIEWGGGLGMPMDAEAAIKATKKLILDSI
ncbi:MAG: sugar phosphate isomerase/epimerase [Lunatimonas sp.]|uniref:sugar phosphate isomerase/epimerase family protein n=1 Tax=Lunatimonas sp. TaxID=2060141 RepID=UPI00263A4591|nr:sugar phosphate isomerase/epimerase family protein [Lunatimonas sp.]MCC5935847.1 sugar phosphate isomerase/epimerase [Lunatimonas sp.]